MASFWRAVLGSSTEPDCSADGVEFWSNPERGGWLTKQGEYIKTWRRRWFVLKQGKLFWFKDSCVTPSSVPRGIIPVSSCLTVKGADDVLNRLFAFELSTPRETMYFIADSDKEKEEWINSIGRSIFSTRAQSLSMKLSTTIALQQHPNCGKYDWILDSSSMFLCLVNAHSDYWFVYIGFLSVLVL